MRFFENILPRSGYAHSAEATAFLSTVYGWMFLGLSITATAAWAVATFPVLTAAIAGNQTVYLVLLLAEVALVFVISGAIRSLSAGAATGLFLLYSVLNGATLSLILQAYTGLSVLMAFLSAACLFGTMSLYGYVTRRDLASWRSLLTVGLIAIIVCMLLNAFLFRSSAFDFVLSIVGIVVFLGLTAYRTQQVLRLGSQTANLPGAWIRKGAIVGALALYIDFINIFLYMLRFMGQRRD